MQHKRFPWLAALIVVGLIVLAGSSLYDNAWSEGFMMGQLAAGQDGLVFPQNHAMYQGGGSFFSVFLRLIGTFFVFGLLFAMAGMAFKLFGFRRWVTENGPGNEQWAGWVEHWHKRHGGRPPWAYRYHDHPDSSPESKTDVVKAEPQPKAGTASESESSPLAENESSTDDAGSEA